MPGAVAAELVEMAHAGLPIVFVERFPDRGVSFRDAAEEDAQVAMAMA